MLTYQHLAALVSGAGLVATIVLGNSGVATAQEKVHGSADFRTAPTVGNGTFEDTVVTGETVWYAVLYKNGAEFTVDASITPPGEQDKGLTLTRIVVGPTLDVLFHETGRIERHTMTVSQPGYSIPDINTWYVAFRLDTTGRRGVQHTLNVELDGFEDPGDRSRCDTQSGCELPQELGKLKARLTAIDVPVENLTGERDRLKAELADAKNERDIFSPITVIASVAALACLAAIGVLLVRRRLRR